MDAALANALFSGTRTGAELRGGLGISQPTLSRLLKATRAEVAVLGRGRSTRYGLYRRIRELPPELPVHRVSQDGAIERIATLVTIAPGRFWFDDLEQPRASREFESLPWFITDMRPQGYLGRLFPLRYEDLSLPDRIGDWNELGRWVAASLTQLFKTEDHKEGVLAFLEKRPPNYVGR